MKKAILILLYSFLFSVTSVYSQVKEVGKDSLLLNLSEVEVNATKVKSPVMALNKGRVVWDLENINKLPQILGQADPMRYSQTLPGVQTNNEYDGGLHIYGCDNTHNHVGIEGVPLYNVNHLLGFFSMFNTSHFQSFAMEKSAVNAEFPNRLGGKVSMQLPDEIPDSVNGDISLGLISSQGTINIPFAQKNMISISARLCYINLLYGNALKIEDSRFKYTFGDINATWQHKANDNNKFLVSFFAGEDRAAVYEQYYQADMGLVWDNMMLMGQWEHKFGSPATMTNTLYYTEYKNNFQINQEAINLELPSRIGGIGYKGELKMRNIDAGVEAIVHNIKPQVPIISGSYNSANNYATQNLITQEYSGYADYRYMFNDDIILNAGLRGSLYVDDRSKPHFGVDPSLSLLINKPKWDFSATLSTRHQYIYQTGFSSMGLPTEFWATCNNENKPQKGFNVISTFGYKIMPGLQVSAEVYYKKLKNLVEYNGNILDFVQTDYAIENQLYHGDGHNYGVNVMLSLSLGKFSGWMSYNIGRALRTFDDKGLVGEYPANHERISELNVVGEFDINKHWSLGATYVFASGTPYTAPEHFYVFSGNVIAQYGEHNACRLSPYSRLDLSVNYKFAIFKTKESGLNLSIYNVLSRANQLYWIWKISKTGVLTYGPASFVVNVLPSISYYIKF